MESADFGAMPFYGLVVGGKAAGVRGGSSSRPWWGRLCHPVAVGGLMVGVFLVRSLAADPKPALLSTGVGDPAGSWDTRFGGTGVNGVIHALVVSSNQVFVGGEFTAIGGVDVVNLARWDGTNWTGVGELDGPVYALAAVETNLYVGGQFTQTGSVAATNVVHWNSLRWASLGTGFDGPVHALVAQGGKLYAGGEFANASETNVANVAVWDGSAWQPMGEGVNGRVLCLAPAGTNAVAVGGEFSQAGGVASRYVARWDGAAWQGMGDGADGPVRAFTTWKSNLVAGGDFGLMGGVATQGVAVWDGRSWLPIDASVDDSVPRVNALVAAGDALFVAGQFSRFHGRRSNAIVRWDGFSWQVLAQGVQGGGGVVHALAVDGQRVYVGGDFEFAGLHVTRNIAAWNLGNTWSALEGGLHGYANTLVTTIRGELYVGGSFDRAGPVTANNIARRIGQVWTALGDGVDGPVHTLAVVGPDVYVGGRFGRAGGQTAPFLARWDGTHWHPVGAGLDGPVYALAVSQDDLYVGGEFTEAGGVKVANVAHWDGAAWRSLGAGMSGPVFSLLTQGSWLYAGGAFTNAGGAQVLNIARWDGGRWSGLAGGVGNTVYALASTENGSLFVGGESSDAGVIDGANNVARWNGTNWMVLGSGVNGTVRALLVEGREVHVGGSFTQAGGTPVMNFARWYDDLETWASYGETTNNGVNGNILALAGGGERLYVGGLFAPAVGPSAATNLAAYSPGRWEVLGRGVAGRTVEGSVLAIATSSDSVYVGGTIGLAGGLVVSNIARWDGGGWAPLGGGLDASVRAVVVGERGEVFAGGDFTQAGGITAYRVARWDGLRWSPLGIGCDGTVHALAEDGGRLYAGGEFTRAGGFSANGVARWDGQAWSRLGVGVQGKVYALAAGVDGKVYAGGEISRSGGVNLNGVAVWDGNTWSPLGAGIQGVVHSMALTETAVFVGGRFDGAGGSPAIRNFARWDGARWWALGAGLEEPDVTVHALGTHPGGAVFLAGTFLTAGGLEVNRVARWDGSRWSMLGAGLNGTAYALGVRGREVFVGGAFTTAGRQPSLRFGRWAYPNQPPVVRLAQPPVGARFVAPADLKLEALASDPDGSVSSVEFYVGTRLLQTLNQPPYVAWWTNVSEGSYALTAVASDSEATRVVSSPVMVVVATNRAPQVSVDQPVTGSRYLLPVEIPIGVNALDLDGRVVSVELLVGDTPMGGLTSEPWEWRWLPSEAGRYVLRARATDDRGLTEVSASVEVQVDAPVAIEFSSLRWDEEGFHGVMQGEPGGKFVLEASTNLVEWMSLSTNRSDAGRFEFVDPTAGSLGWRFYRGAYGPW